MKEKKFRIFLTKNKQKNVGAKILTPKDPKKMVKGVLFLFLFLHRIILNILFKYDFFFTEFANPPFTLFQKCIRGTDSVLSHPRQNPLLACIVPKR